MELINLGGRIVNNYLIKEKGKYILVDTGYPGGFESFEKKLKKNRLDVKDIEYIFLTHAHDDHAGFLNNVLENSSAKLILNEKALERLYLGQNSFDGFLVGSKARLLGKMIKLMGKEIHLFPPFDKKYNDRILPINLNNWYDMEEILGASIIETPGHTKCSISLMLDSGEFFCGDAAMNGVLSTKKVSLWIWNIKEYFESWDKIVELKPITIYPGHGRPFLYKALENNRGKEKWLKINTSYM